jgi:hypothetical protein
MDDDKKARVRAAFKRMREASAEQVLNNWSAEYFRGIEEGTMKRAPSASDAARALSALGASKGGKASAAKLTPKARKDRARKAATARWAAADKAEAAEPARVVSRVFGRRKAKRPG